MFDARKARSVPGASPPFFFDCVVAPQTIPLPTSEPFADIDGPPFIPGFSLLTAKGVVTNRSFTKLYAFRASRRSHTYRTPSFLRDQNAVPRVCAQSFCPQPFV